MNRGLDATLGHFLKGKNHPCWYDVKPLAPNSSYVYDEEAGTMKHSSKQWPVVYFVGGIWNSCELYTTY